VFPLVSAAPLHALYLIGKPEKEVHAYVFFETESDVTLCIGNGVSRQVHDAILAGFEKQEDCFRPTLSVAYDSHENVQKTCNGNYYKYLK
jgi:hypothetical protein